MCTLVILRRPDHRWPLVLGANRDEMADRRSRPPGRHWPERPEIIAGFDETAGGSWMGLNDWGVVAAVLNRRGTLGPAPDKRSRGELVLEALDHADAAHSARALAGIDPDAYKPFNLFIGDDRDAFWLRHDGSGPIQVVPVRSGISMLTADDLNDPRCPRLCRYRPLFEKAAAPDPESCDWSEWILLLSSPASATGDPRDAMTIVTDGLYGTRSSSLLALPKAGERAAVWLYADGRPGDARYEPVSSGG